MIGTISGHPALLPGTSSSMRLYVKTLDLADDPEAIAAYERFHREVWPEVVAALRAIGVASLRIFRRGTRLVMLVEFPDDLDPDAAFARYANLPRTAEWEAQMRRFQRQLADAAPGAWWCAMEEIFRLPDSPSS